jgi:acetate---CoA ligase (ADP-forming) subunit alpha
MNGTALDHELKPFLQPESVAVIGATERPGSWGAHIMQSLLSSKYPGRIFPVNRHAKRVYEIPAYPQVSSIPGSVDLAILIIPEDAVEEAIRACGKKGVKGVTIITAGFGEATENGRGREKAMAQVARSYGMRILGPNVSGTFNLHAQFNSTRSHSKRLVATALAGISQGGYAFSDLLAVGDAREMGVGKFAHTGNECDLQATDFLGYFGKDPEVKGILMYLETLRDGKRFLEVARKVTKEKPVVVYKAGRKEGGSRAALSHTGAMTGRGEVYQGGFHQVNIVQCPSMELLLPLGHALIERPPIRGNRVAIVTMGGSWGVALTDCLEGEGLAVPELSPAVQRRLRDLGMPERASTKNPVDMGATGFAHFSVETLVDMGRITLSSGEVDALILHGLGRVAMGTENSLIGKKSVQQMEKDVLLGYSALQAEIGRPVMIGSALSQWESPTVHELHEAGIRFYHRLDEIALILSLMHGYWQRRQLDDERPT